MPKNKRKEKWLIAKRRGNQPIRTTRLRFRTKKEATKKASKLNKAYKGTKIKESIKSGISSENIELLTIEIKQDKFKIKTIPWDFIATELVKAS